MASGSTPGSDTQALLILSGPTFPTSTFAGVCVCVCVCMCVYTRALSSFSRVQVFVTLWTVAFPTSTFAGVCVCVCVCVHVR